MACVSNTTMLFPIQIFLVPNAGRHHRCGGNSQDHEGHPHRYHPYPSLTKMMKTYLELKDLVAKPPCPSPTYPERPDRPSLQRAKISKSDTSKETKKRNKTQQTNRQFKVRVVEKPLILPRVSATLIPTTAATTPPTMSNPTRATTPWPSTFLASANLFVTRSWPVPPKKESNPTLAKQKVMESKGASARKIAISHSLPFIQQGSTTASNLTTTNITAVPNTQSPGKRCNVSCPICTQSASCPSPVDSDWSEGDWDDKTNDEEKMRKKQRREKSEGALSYYLLEPIYNHSQERNSNFGNGSDPSSNTKKNQK